MKFLNDFWNKIKQPNWWILVIFYVVFAGLISATLALVITNPKQSVIHYILYALSAVLLAYFVYTIVFLAPKIRDVTIKLLRKNKFTNRLLDSYGYRTMIFAVISFAINIAYVVLQAVLGIIERSWWYISLAAYFLVLSLLKGCVFYSKFKHDTEISQAKTYRNCGILFVFLTVAFSGIVLLIYTSNMYFEYAGLMIYVVATYTFYNAVMSIINFVKVRDHNNLYVRSIRNINLASSLVSIVVLQVAMFQAFAPESNRSIANALTGGAMSLAILVVGAIMIATANKKIKLLENKNDTK